MAKKFVENRQKDSMVVCFEKFSAYAAPRGIILYPETYAFYEVRKGNTKRVLGAVKAINARGEEGWVVNWADKRRHFVASSDKRVVIGKKVSSAECRKERQLKKEHHASIAID